MIQFKILYGIISRNTVLSLCAKLLQLNPSPKPYANSVSINKTKLFSHSEKVNRYCLRFIINKCTYNLHSLTSKDEVLFQ